MFVLTKAHLCWSHVRCHRAPESEWPWCAHGAIFLSVQVASEGAVAGRHVGWRWPAPKGSCMCLLGVMGILGTRKGLEHARMGRTQQIWESC